MAKEVEGVFRTPSEAEGVRESVARVADGVQKSEAREAEGVRESEARETGDGGRAVGMEGMRRTKESSPSRSPSGVRRGSVLDSMPSPVPEESIATPRDEIASGAGAGNPEPQNLNPKLYKYIYIYIYIYVCRPCPRTRSRARARVIPRTFSSSYVLLFSLELSDTKVYEP